MGKPIAVHSPKHDEQLQKNVVMGWTAEDIIQAGKEQLLTMQYRLGLGNKWGYIDFPEGFLPSGLPQHDSNRIVRLATFLPQCMSLDSTEANAAWTEILRFVVARLTLISPRRSRMVSYSTCCSNLRHLKTIVRAIVQLPVGEGYFWSRLGIEAATAKSSAGMAIFSLIRWYHQVGALPDSFRTDATILTDELERDRSGEPDYTALVEENKKWQPLPMEFVAQMGWRSLRIIKSVAPTLLDALEAALEVSEVTHGSRGKVAGKLHANKMTLDARNDVIANWQWKDELGEPLECFGFDCCLFYRRGVEIEWPPKNFSHAIAIAHRLVKPAHLWMVLLSSGPRNSEATSMRDDCLIPSSEGNFRWKGRTYKMTGITGGREIDAIAPEIITQSLVQQIRLARLTSKDKGFSGNALWVGETIKSAKNLSANLNSFVDALGQRHLLGEDNPSCHEHRFRKTLAKIVALALTNAIMILKDCFGHTDPVMTLLSYITADPSIAQEVIKVQKELTIMMAVEVITNSETTGGPGAPALRQRADDYLKRIGKSKFEPQDAYEFARRETFDGRSWMMIAPGVLCTAPHDVTQVSTPCAAGQGRHNPANCKTDCDWQLLLKGYYVTQAEDAVDYALKNLQRAIDVEDEAGVAFWSGQAKTWLYRHEEILEKWKDHPLVVAHVSRPRKTVRVAE